MGSYADRLFRLGMDSREPGNKSQAKAPVIRAGMMAAAAGPALPDHFIMRDGQTFAGTHLIIDLWDAHELDSPEAIEAAFRAAIAASGATLIHMHFKKFGDGGGVTGVAVLSESHISIHTWPERGYASIDVYMCGDADPSLTIPVFLRAFRPGRSYVQTLRRGVVEAGGQSVVQGHHLG